MENIDNTSIIKTNLSITKKDLDEYIIGNGETYITLDYIGKDIILNLNKGISIDGLNETLDTNDYDITDFIITLRDLGLIYSIDGFRISENNLEKKIKPFEKILASIFFNKLSITLYIAMLIFSVIYIIVSGEFAILYKEIIISKYIGINLLLIIIVSWILLLLHEMGHYYAAIRFNIKPTFKISVRLFWIVIEANVNRLWEKEKKEKYITFSAGVFVESIILFFCSLFLLLNIQNNLIRLIIFIILYRLLWQLLIFLRTDLYFIVITYLDTNSLHFRIMSSLKNSFRKNIKLNIEEKIYVLFMIIGFFVILIMAIFFQIPTIYILLTHSLHEIISNNVFYKIDGLLTFFILTLLFIIWIIGYKNKLKDKDLQKSEY
ncbi:hypothetical protein [Mammaliicoccus sciuri]|uniref:hypothetical protein n=1 Tax=Mammaliicoccus sciuri TaxID=1296 RepID=UPI00195295CC|nr:hypothetical protein [Mammaliicoccus sciuri]MCJ0908669.1 hypothetical protein [Mammaliicoccus sciuri]MCJ1760976.1 hypothetical protein [Mammaliicoccus sciuri]MEB6120004.1 hypothetical protein [Mammaliicoccus sciuri]MEB6215009.1 hypothetical protein [Mammaliicoccus sciuri]MEB6330124.1 hypothetical protein [Mammaliicoccus sciuri]